MRKYVLLSIDDTVKEDVKAAKLLERYNLNGTFYLDAIRIGKELKVEDVRWLSECHEVGSHGYYHTDLSLLNEKKIFDELSESKSFLEEITGKPIFSLAYPYGDYDRRVIKVAKKAGYRCARGTLPYDIKIDNKLYELRTTLWADPNPYRYYFHALSGFLKNLKFFPLLYKPSILKHWDRLALGILQKLSSAQHRIKFHMIIHSRFIEKRNEWNKLEEIFSYIQSEKFFDVFTVAQYCDSIKGRE